MNNIFVLPLKNSEQLCLISLIKLPLILSIRKEWWINESGYVYTRIYKIGNRADKYYLHRVITENKMLNVSHKNRLKWDNRDENLEEASFGKNNTNIAPYHSNKTSKTFLGVYRNKINEKWIAQHGRIYIGSFDFEKDAAIARDKFVANRYGRDGVYLNFPNLSSQD